MLGAIKDFFMSIMGIITGLVDFVIGIIKDLVYMIQLLGQFVSSLPRLFSWLPNEVMGLLITLFGIVVIYKVIGREG